MYQQSMLRANIRKIITIFRLKIIIFTAIKNRSILHRRVIIVILEDKRVPVFHAN